MAHTTRLINFTRDLKYIVSSLRLRRWRWRFKNHCVLFLHLSASKTTVGQSPSAPLRLPNPAPHKFPHIAAKTRYFSIFPSKAQISLFGFSHFSFRIVGQKCCFFCAIRQFSRLKFYIVFTFHKVNMHNLSPQNYRILLTFLQYRLY